eukprot:2960566-Alexandrium_andersonii.AAC.1
MGAALRGQRVRAAAQPAELKRIDAAAQAGAALFLTAGLVELPCKMLDDEVRRACWWRLGLTQSPTPGCCALHTKDGP